MGNYLRSTWLGMVNRCTDPRNRAWARYGGRGIGVSERWLVFDDFKADILRDIGERPPGRNGRRPAYSLDRIDNDKGYEPGNVRWADRTTQALNRHHGTLGYNPNTRWGLQRSAGLCGRYRCKLPPAVGRTLCEKHATSNRDAATESMRRVRDRKRLSNTGT
jgi:hypothetical protein